MHQINHKSIKAGNPRSRNHELGTDSRELGEKQVNSFDSAKNAELGSNFLKKIAALRLVYTIRTSNQQAFKLENE